MEKTSSNILDFVDAPEQVLEAFKTCYATEIMNAVMDALWAHTTMSKQARDSKKGALRVEGCVAWTGEAL